MVQSVFDMATGIPQNVAISQQDAQPPAVCALLEEALHLLPRLQFLDNSHLSFIHLLCTCILYTYVYVCTLIMNSVLLGFQHLWTQREGMTMDRHWRRQMPMRSSQPKVGVFFLPGTGQTK